MVGEAGGDTAKTLQPRPQPLDLPPSRIATQDPAILRGRRGTIALLGSDQRNAARAAGIVPA